MSAQHPQPHEIKFSEFVKHASVKLLQNHGRKAEVFYHNESCGFVDTENLSEALKYAHQREVNNALYLNSERSMNEGRNVSMPPLEVINEYPGLKVAFSISETGKIGPDGMVESKQSLYNMYQTIRNSSNFGDYTILGPDKGSGTYHGRVVFTTDKHAAQLTGRKEIMIHHKDDLVIEQDGLKQDTLMTIAYKHGKGNVKCNEKEQGVSR